MREIVGGLVGLVLILGLAFGFAHSPSPEPPRFETYTVVDLLNEVQHGVLVDNETGTSMTLGTTRYPGHGTVGSEFIPFNSGNLYYTDSARDNDD